jgi:hypothetical protein
MDKYFILQAVETKRQKLKVEHDQMQERLNQLVSNLSAEERACERISIQVGLKSYLLLLPSYPFDKQELYLWRHNYVLKNCAVI